jgi:hypothetical protein
MLKKILNLTMVALVFIYAGCNPKGGENTNDRPVLSKNIEYDVSINNFKLMKLWGLVSSSPLWYRYNLESSVRCAYLELLFQKALAGKLDLYDMNDQPIDTIALKILLNSTDSKDTIIMIRPSPPYDEFDTVVAIPFDPSTITALRFREDWTYDPATMAISKKVLAIAPIWTPVTFDAEGNECYGTDKPMFWIKFSKEPTNTKVLTKRIMSNTSCIGFRDACMAKNADTIELKKYFNSILNRVYNDSIEFYDPCAEPGILQVSGKKWYKAMNRVDTIKVGDKDTVIKSEPNLTDLRFLEEWSFDTTTMAIQKTVVGICPVERVFCTDGSFKGYKPYFWTYFKDVWTPFDGKLELIKIKKEK